MQGGVKASNVKARGNQRQLNQKLRAQADCQSAAGSARKGISPPENRDCSFVENDRSVEENSC